MTQCERIVDYLDSHVGITSKEAMEKLGVYRLASRIHDLKESGYEFERITREEVNRYLHTHTKVCIHFIPIPLTRQWI